MTAWSLVPNGSLLEWLDSYVLGLRTRMYKTMGKWNNLLSVLNVLNGLPKEVKAAIHIKGFPVVGEQFPYAHGTFDDFKFWDPAFWDPKNKAPVDTIDRLREQMRKEEGS